MRHCDCCLHLEYRPTSNIGHNGAVSGFSRQPFVQIAQHPQRLRSPFGTRIQCSGLAGEASSQRLGILERYQFTCPPLLACQPETCNVAGGIWACVNRLDRRHKRNSAFEEIACLVLRNPEAILQGRRSRILPIAGFLVKMRRTTPLRIKQWAANNRRLAVEPTRRRISEYSPGAANEEVRPK